MKIKKAIRCTNKFFNWLFKGKSLSSHLAFLIVAYFGMKLFLFPALLSVTGLTDVVAVLSGSMHHQPGSFENTFTGWLVFNGYNETEFSVWPFVHGLDVGDAVTVVGGEIAVGDVIIYYYDNMMIIHRVVNITDVDGVKYYTTKGDANPSSLPFETMVHESMVVGKAGLRVPWLGWPRTLMYYLINV